MIFSKPFRTVSWFLAASAVVGVVGLNSSQAGRPGGSVSRPLSLEWRADPSQPPEIRLSSENGASIVTVNNNVDLVRGGWPRWSPDGQLIGGYFKNFRDAAGNVTDVGIMTMAAGGAAEQAAVTRNQFIAFNLSRPGVLSADFPVVNRDKIACWLGTGALVFEGEMEYAPEFFGASDPSYHAFGSRLFAVNAAGVILPLTETPSPGNGDYDDFHPHWSPAINKIIFVSNRSGFDELYAMNPDGSGLTPISDFQGTVHLRGPVWNPTGSKLVVSVQVGAVAEPDLWILDVDLNQPLPGAGVGGRLTAIDPVAATGNGVHEEMAAWAPTGDRIVFARYWFSSGQKRTFQIVIADVARRTETVVVNQSKPAVLFPDWNPVP